MGETGSLIFLIGFNVVGWSFLIVYTTIKNKTDARRKKIYSIISHSAGKESIDSIAAILQTDYLSVVKDLENMIANARQFELLYNAYIDNIHKAIVLAPPKSKVEQSVVGSLSKKIFGADFSDRILGKKPNQSEQPKINTIKKCPNCGAPTDGQITECEFCGSPIK